MALFVAAWVAAFAATASLRHCSESAIALFAVAWAASRASSAWRSCCQNSGGCTALATAVAVARDTASAAMASAATALASAWRDLWTASAWVRRKSSNSADSLAVAASAASRALLSASRSTTTAAVLSCSNMVFIICAKTAVRRSRICAGTPRTTNMFKRNDERYFLNQLKIKRMEKVKWIALLAFSK